MAKTKDGVNMSKAIREVLESNPTIKAKEVVSTLAEKGIKVRMGLVYLVKGSLKRKRGRPKKTRQARVAVASTNGSHDLLATIHKVRKVADEVGGMKKLIALAEALNG